MLSLVSKTKSLSLPTNPVLIGIPFSSFASMQDLNIASWFRGILTI